MTYSELAKVKLAALPFYNASESTPKTAGIEKLRSEIEEKFGDKIQGLWLFEDRSDDGGLMLLLKSTVKTKTEERLYLNAAIAEYVRQDIIFDYDRDLIQRENEAIEGAIIEGRMFTIYDCNRKDE